MMFFSHFSEISLWANKPCCFVLQVDLSFYCSGCNYPFCDAECAADPIHLEEECAVLANIKDLTKKFFEDSGPDTINFDAYHIVLPLRLALLRDSNPDVFLLTSRSMDHNTERRASNE